VLTIELRAPDRRRSLVVALAARGGGAATGSCHDCRTQPTAWKLRAWMAHVRRRLVEDVDRSPLSRAAIRRDLHLVSTLSGPRPADQGSILRSHRCVNGLIARRSAPQ